MLEALLWLSLNVYHEGRNLDQLDQIAIAHVTINRSKNRKLPIKKVVLQPYQFSWTNQKEDYYPHEENAFDECVESALVALKGYDFTGGATHYHRVDIIPEWTNRLQYTRTYGSHILYK